LSQLQTDQFIAGIAGRKKELKGLGASKAILTVKSSPPPSSTGGLF